MLPVQGQAATVGANGHGRSEGNDRLAPCIPVSIAPYRLATARSFDGRSAAVVLRRHRLHLESRLPERLKCLAEIPKSAGLPRIVSAMHPDRSFPCTAFGGTTVAVYRCLKLEATGLEPESAAYESLLSCNNATRFRSSEDVRAADETPRASSIRTLKLPRVGRP